MSAVTKPAHKRELFGHPVGLYVLFFTEMWERFSYYGMRALLTLYMTAETLKNDPQSGLGWTTTEALALYGWYTMLVYVMSIPGGFLADRYLGQKKAVTIGAILLTIGHGVLAIDYLWAYYTGLGFVILGVGMLKPNISTMVGGLYKQNDIRRDKGFSIFYVGINLGSFLASITVGIVAAVYGWHYGFGLAGIGMFVGLLVYLYGQRFLVHVGNQPTLEEKASDISLAQLFSQLLKSPLQLTIVGVLLAYSIYAGFTYDGPDNWGYGILFVFLSLITGMMMMIYKNLNGKVEKDRYVVLLISLLMVIVFWGCFEQMGGLMNLYAQEKTNRMFMGWEVPAAWFQAANAGFIILFAVTVANFWARRKLKGKEATSLFKMATGVIIMGVGFVYMVFASLQYESSGSSAMYWLVLTYLFHTIGELCLSPVSLSFFTKLAPARYMALMMGVYWAATGLGNKVAGIVGESSVQAGELKVFGGLFIFAVLFGTLVLFLLKPLKRLTHGAEDNETEITAEDEVETIERG
ncbi:MAG TPA: MFS transporter [Muricauda sp.]|uniref:Peptide MFS transporter n=1 Tax=Flagellimonas aurea TaxID=2915619 RepID=A0ABS3G9T1_9FLAO|nr:peptide MFS transporter [Allomuricauda aurea]MAO17932.1 MFS transporter [Allomuricauda sp.]MBO0355332.1 peptide MFS transporter [Allomuricauda aurea]HBU79594.1 MFS transporter [Allomuricauda sp.]|tara:strand:- start:413 stop:1975 length:1563 start_codon:yes stop_codon:yes gene_type:complete